MAYDLRFGPLAQPPAQRAWVLEQMQATLPYLKTNATAKARLFFARYIAGELSWGEMRRAIDTTTGKSGTDE